MAIKSKAKDIGIHHSKDEFIHTLLSMTDIEINDFIKKNGKPVRKPIPVLIKITEDNKHLFKLS